MCKDSNQIVTHTGNKATNEGWYRQLHSCAQVTLGVLNVDNASSNIAIIYVRVLCFTTAFRGAHELLAERAAFRRCLRAN